MEGGRTLGRFVNTGLVLGRGSFATVYKGHVVGAPTELVAIKAMYPEKVKQKQMLQEREIEVMRSLRHPNVVELLDVIFRGPDDGGRAPTIYMVFEVCWVPSLWWDDCALSRARCFQFMAGGDFAAYLRSQPGRRLSESATKHWMTQLKQARTFCIAMYGGYAKYCVRFRFLTLALQLKPQNLLLSSRDEATAVLKLADFGFARFIHNQSLIETVCGTPLYMAPEILRSEKYSTRSDLWSVGCIMFQCLVGRAPFVVRTHYELIMKLETEPVTVPTDVRSHLSPEAHQLLMQLLTKEEAKRIDWDAFARHPWFGEEPQQAPQLAHSAGPVAASGGSPGVSGPQLTPALIMDRHETTSRLHRVCDRALAVLELADMKMDHGLPDDAAVLYWKGLDCIALAAAGIRADKDANPGVSVHDTLLERLRLKNRIYQERATRAIAAKRNPATHARAPTELLYEFALQMGRDGGVSEILRDFAKANKLYANGAVILELLLSLAEESVDRAILVESLQRFTTRIAHVRTQMLEEEEEATDEDN